ncbi:DoxX family protein [Oerskovia sp. Root22]|uniref:DoxX family protein n=1 Tax=Oerskovia sp. Root22 TaxID=1736494 RepID=UPI0006FA22EE|nr:DoxX family protein [Oerskovia sp. Root22]KRC37634.1 DoxX family protein [Oerskovia sp. Root22]
MNVALWIAAGLLAVAFAGAGFMKLTTPAGKLMEQMRWVTPERLTAVRVLGALELLGAIGLILPLVTGIAPILTPIAATGLAITQIGAIPLHVRLGEKQSVPVNALLLLLAVFVAVGRFAGWGA